MIFISRCINNMSYTYYALNAQGQLFVIESALALSQLTLTPVRQYDKAILKRALNPSNKCNLCGKAKTTSYINFSTLARTFIKEHGLGLALTMSNSVDFAKRCGQTWRKMDDTDKAKFNNHWCVSTEETQNTLKKYFCVDEEDEGEGEGDKDDEKEHEDEGDEGDEGDDEGSAASSTSPSSPFMYFLNNERGKVRAQHPDYDAAEIGKELGRRWRSRSNERADYCSHERAVEQ